MARPLIIIGGGGHCKSSINVIEEEGKYNIVGILDVSKELQGKNVCGYPVLGGDELIEELNQKGNSFFIGVGQVNEGKVREKIYNHCVSLNCYLPNIISPSSLVAKNASLGQGNIILQGCIINSEVKIGSNNIINTKSLIEHEVQIGDNNHISTGCILNGQVIVGDNNFIGSNSVAINNIEIGNQIILGAGSIIVKSILDSGTYVGSPAKKIK